MKRKSSRKVVLSKKGLILCEGETETNYFKGLVTQEKFRRKFASVGVEIYKPKDHSPVGLVNEAKSRINEAKRSKSSYDFVWIIFDKDGHQNIPKAFSDAGDVKDPTIEIAFSVSCFEYFILMHFVKTTKPFTKCDDVIKELKRHFADYEKSRNLFEDLKDKQDIACENCEWLCERGRVDMDNGSKIYDLPSYTNVHHLINALNSY